MKKIMKYLCAIVLAVLTMFTLSACDQKTDVNVESITIEIKSGTFKTEYNLGDIVDTSNAKLVAKVKIGEKESEIEFKDFTIDPIDTTTIGEQYVKVKCGEIEGTIKIIVKDTLGEGAVIDAILMPTFYDTYKLNSAEKSADAKETEYKITKRTYVVGDDNNFVFMPEISMTDANGKDATLKSYDFVTKYEIKENDDYRTLTNEEIELYFDEIQYKLGIFNLSDDAIGKTFRISLGLKQEDLQEGRTYEITNCVIEFEVVDGYNVYNAKELSLIDNMNSAYFGRQERSFVENGWVDFKENQGYTSATSGVVFQNDLTITRKELPETFFNADGTIKNRADLYTRYVEENQSFTIYGN